MKNKKEIKNILVITLSNVGDVVLTFPVIDALRQQLPNAALSIMVSAQARELFDDNPNIREVIIYNKRADLKAKLRLVLQLRKKGYDLVLDLRNTLFPYLIGAPLRASLNQIRSIFCRTPRRLSHMRDRHLWKLTSTLSSFFWGESVITHSSAPTNSQDERYINQFLREKGVKDTDRIVILNPGAHSHIKRWRKDGFRYICQRLISTGRVKVVIIGEREDLPLAKEIVSGLGNEPIIACGRTSLTQLFSLIGKSTLLVSNDTAPIHIASYLRIPVVAIFGPTNPDKYKPQGANDIIIRQELSCSPCERALCQFNEECMQLVRPEEVFAAVDKLL